MLLAKLIKRKKENKGSVISVEMLIMLVVIIFALALVLDFGIYFINRNTYAMAAEKGAKLAAIFGGAGPTEISKKYGETFDLSDPWCVNTHATTPAACAVAINLKDSSKALMGSRPVDISCGPTETYKIGERVWCEIKWHYQGVPTSMASRFLANNRMKVSSESEVLNRRTSTP